MLQAKVKSDYRFGNALQAFGRLEFTKTEWRDVPAELEAQARAHENLEIRERPVIEAGAIETVAPAEAGATVTTETLPTSEQLLDQMLADMPGEDQPIIEEVKETRRGRGGKRG